MGLVVDSHLCGLGSIPSKSCSFLIVLEGLHCASCDQHVKYLMGFPWLAVCYWLNNTHTQRWTYWPRMPWAKVCVVGVNFVHTLSTANHYAVLKSFITHNYYLVHSDKIYISVSTYDHLATTTALIERAGCHSPH